jgi:uncharacterized protein (DUF58 family)
MNLLSKDLTDRGHRPVQSWFRLLASHSEEAVFLALAGFLFLVATNTQTGWLYIVSALLAGVFVAGFIGPRTTLHGLQVRRRMPAPATQGDQVYVEMEVFNPGPSDRALVLVEQDLPDTLPGQPRTRRFLLERLPAGSSVRVDCPVPASLRGYHRLPPLRLKSATPLGLFPAQRSVPDDPQPLVVYPRPLNLVELLVPSRIAPQAHQRHTSNRVGTSEDFLGIRPYSPGEDTRFIHWPATARMGEVMVREFQGNSGQGMAVLIETWEEALAGSGEDSNLEVAISAAAALAGRARRQGLPFLQICEWAGQIHVSRTSGEGALDFLARIQPPGRLSRFEFLEAAAGRAPAEAHLLLLLLAPLGDMQGLSHLLERRGGLSVVFFPGPDQPEDQKACQDSLRVLRASGVRSWIHLPGIGLTPAYSRGTSR